LLVEELIPKAVAANGKTQGPDYRGRKKSGEKSADADGYENMSAGLEALLGGVHRQEEQERLAYEDGASKNPEQPILISSENGVKEFFPVRKVASGKKDNNWDDEAQENQRVEDRDQDAPFAHDASSGQDSVYHRRRRGGHRVEGAERTRRNRSESAGD
jgi:hypothetical protein